MGDTSHQPDIASWLWERYGSLDLERVPAEAKRVATHCMMDWLGCAAAGSREPLSEILRAELASNEGEASIIGSSLRASKQTAALLNGAAGHALDYDDTGGMGHPSAPMLPAALAVAEAGNRTGRDLLEAFVVGYEVECRIGSLFGGKIYVNGWHTTSAMGIFGAAAAVSYLLGLDTDQFGNALGLAASQSSGVKANFGTMTKPFHAGHAAERGCLSALLAARGYTANANALDGNQGLLQAMGVGNDLLHKLDEMEQHWYLPNTNFKYHAACYLTHSTINNVLEATKGVRSEDVDSVTLKVNPTIIDVCGLYDRPQTGLEAKFSLTGAAAMALSGVDTSNPGVFDESVVRQPALQEAMTRVNIETEDSYRTTQTSLTVALRDGSSRSAESDSGVPWSDLDAQEQALSRKFVGLAQSVLGADTEELARTILDIEALDSVTHLFAAPRQAA